MFDLLSKWTSQTVLNCSDIANVLQDDPEEEELRRKKKPVPKYRSCPSANREKIWLQVVPCAAQVRFQP